MTKRPVNLDTVRRVRAELRALALAHPELTSPEGQERLGAYLETLDDKPPVTTKSETVSLRLTPDELEHLDRVAALVPVATRQAVARAALRMGLEAIEANPSVLLAQPAKKGGK